MRRGIVNKKRQHLFNATLYTCCLLMIAVSQLFAQTPFQRGINLTQWFQTSSARQIQFSKFTYKDFEQIKSLGCDVIRLPINLHAMTAGGPDYEIDPLFFRFLDEVITWSEELNIYLILDNHTFDPNENTDPAIGSILNKVWSQMAQRYKDRSEFILYEVLNEPHGISSSLWGQIQGDVINVIREFDTKHYIIVGGVNYNSYNDLSGLPVYTDDKLIYTFHFYDPFLFTHQGASWTSPSLEPLGGIPFPYGASPMPSLPSSLRGTWIESAYSNYAQEGTNARVKQLIDIAGSFAAARNVPVFCGEFGVFMPNSDDQQRVAWYKLVSEYLNEKNIPWTMWDYRGSFGLFEKNTSELFESDLNVPLLNAVSLNVPPQVNPLRRLQTIPFDIYDDYIAEGITDVSGSTEGTLDWYYEDVHTGMFAVKMADVDQYFTLRLEFRPQIDMSLLPGNNYALDFWVKGDTPGSSFDIRFVDSKASATDLPWRMGITVDERLAAWDNDWHHVVIPLAELQEKGSWDEGWYPPEGKFSWSEVQRFEIVAEMQSLRGTSFFFDEIKVTGDPLEVTSTEKAVGFVHEVYPNPAHDYLEVRYELRQQTPVDATLINTTGQRVRAHDYGTQPAGINRLTFDLHRLPPGLYFLRISSPAFSFTKKVVVR